MKYFILYLSVLLICCITNAQGPLAPIMKSYFRINPFEMRFSSFIISLQQDPWFTIETYERRTDSTFFFLSGTYKNFNPFQFKANNVHLIIAEEDFKHKDSLNTLDTMIIIQLIGLADSARSSTALVSKEFSRFQRKYSSNFWKTDYSNDEFLKTKKWELMNCFVFPYSISPLSIAWGRMPDTHEYSFIITIRCKVKENQADFIPWIAVNEQK